MKARPTTYNGIQMRSRLEAAYAQMLDRRPGYEPGIWEYEPACFADEMGQYLPDFRIAEGHYVEVKPEPILADREGLAAALERMEIIWASEPDAVLGLVVGHDTVSGPRFGTSFVAIGARRDATWRLTTPGIAIPLTWDRKRQADAGTPQGQIAELKAKLQRTDPVLHAAKYNQLFAELVELEKRRRAQRETSMGSGAA